MENKKIIIAGGTGFIGQALIDRWSSSNKLVILTRAKKNADNNAYQSNRKILPGNKNIQFVHWDARSVDKRWLCEMENADLLINLSGKSVNCRYQIKQKQQVYYSRIHSTEALGNAIQQLKNPPKLWINASSATIYKHSIEKANDEQSGEISLAKKDNMPWNFIDALRTEKNKLLARRLHQTGDELADPETDFSVKVVKDWEQVFFSQSTPGTRKVALRTAITLGNGGVMVPYLNLCKAGLGGRHGSGKQMFSWVHINDFAGMIEWLFENNSEGVYNCVSPNAVSNKEFMKTLCNAIDRKFAIPSPAWLLELGAFIIGTETELMLKSRWVIPARALNEGFKFQYPYLENAIADIVEGYKK